MPVRPSACFLALAAAVTLTGCATTEHAAQGVRPTDPTVALVEIRSVEAGISGVSGQQRAVLYADGTLLRSNGPSGWVTSSWTDVQVDELMAQVESTGLLADDLDLGHGRITDSPWTTITVATAAGPHELRVEAPGLTDGLSEQQRRDRAAVDQLVDRLMTADGQLWSPDRALAWIEDGNLLDLEVPAPLWTGPTPLEQGATCVDLVDGDLTALADLLDAEATGDGLERSIVVQEQDGHTYRLRVRELLPHDPGCP